MLDFGQKRKVRKFLYHPATVWTLLVVVLLAIHSTWSVYQKKRESEKFLAEAESRLAVLEERESTLQNNIERIKTPAGQEEAIRSKFNVAKQEENVVIVVESEATTTNIPPKPASWWAKLRNFFHF